MSLRVEFAFDQNLLAGYGYTEDDVIWSIKAAYAKYGIRCATEKPILSFVGGERESDFAHMWIIIMDLCDSAWFLDCATSCMWYRKGHYEDVLAQARNDRQKRE